MHKGGKHWVAGTLSIQGKEMIVSVHRKSLLTYPDIVKLNCFYMLLRGEISGLKLLSQTKQPEMFGIISTNPLDKLKSTEKSAEKQVFSNYPRNLAILFCLLLCAFEKPWGSSHQRAIKQITTALLLQGKGRAPSTVCRPGRCLLPCHPISHVLSGAVHTNQA